MTGGGQVWFFVTDLLFLSSEDWNDHHTLILLVRGAPTRCTNSCWSDLGLRVSRFHAQGSYCSDGVNQIEHRFLRRTYFFFFFFGCIVQHEGS